MGWVQLVVVVDAALADVILGNQEALSKALEPDLSDALISHGHRTMFSSETNSPYWRLIRKGTAPAFISANIKCAFTCYPIFECVRISACFRALYACLLGSTLRMSQSVLCLLAIACLEEA